MITFRKNIDGFMKEFKEEITKMPHVKRVEFFGSIRTANWELGKSDVDVIVYGDIISANIKREIVLKLRELNTKYELRLEMVRCCHPTPFFLDSSQLIAAFKDMMNGHSHIVELGRQFLKQNAPTYGEIWAMEDSMKIIESFLPPLPLPIPKLSEIFDKFR